LKEGVLFFKAAREKGLEGIVAEHSRSAYRIGRRRRKWLKVKTRLTQDCVITGFTEPRGRRKYFGSLVLGAFEGNTLIYIGHSGGRIPGGRPEGDIREIEAPCPEAMPLLNGAGYLRPGHLGQAATGLRGGIRRMDQGGDHEATRLFEAVRG
jgi:hypothetical protein